MSTSRALLALRVRLELTEGEGGVARGRIDGTPIELTSEGVLRVPLERSWPALLERLPAPDDALEGLGAPSLYNGAKHKGWMGRAFLAPEVEALASQVAAGPLQVEIRDEVLLATPRMEAEGEALRQAVRTVAALARVLPKAMAEAVSRTAREEGVSDVSARPAETGPVGVAVGRPLPQAETGPMGVAVLRPAQERPLAQDKWSRERALEDENPGGAAPSPGELAAMLTLRLRWARRFVVASAVLWLLALGAIGWSRTLEPAVLALGALAAGVGGATQLITCPRCKQALFRGRRLFRALAGGDCPSCAHRP